MEKVNNYNGERTMTKGRVFSAQAIILIILAVTISGCGKPSNDKLAEIIKTSPQKGTVFMGPQFKVVQFDSVEVISVHKSDTDLTAVMPSNTVKIGDPAYTQKALNVFEKKTLFVRSSVTGKVVPTVTLPAPFVMRPISPELSLQKKTNVWTIIRSRDGEWVCETVLGVEVDKGKADEGEAAEAETTKQE